MQMSRYFWQYNHIVPSFSHFLSKGSMTYQPVYYQQQQYAYNNAIQFKNSVDWFKIIAVQFKINAV